MTKVAVYTGEGSDASVVIALMKAWSFSVDEVDKPDLVNLSNESIDVLYLPPGYYIFEEATNTAISEFTRRGGGVVGSCCGAWNIACSIGLIPSSHNQILMEGRVSLRPKKGNHPILSNHVKRKNCESISRDRLPMTHINGALFMPADRETILATFDEQDQFAAILAAEVGKGRAVAFSSHAEIPVKVEGKEIDNSPLLKDAILWAARSAITVNNGD